MQPQDISAFEFGGPATYRIVVQGMVSREWSRRLGGMAIMTLSPESGVPQTTLLGRIRDQPALRGILETLYALHLPIVEVKKVDTNCDQDPAEIKE